MSKKEDHTHDPVWIDGRVFVDYYGCEKCGIVLDGSYSRYCPGKPESGCKSWWLKKKKKK